MALDADALLTAVCAWVETAEGAGARVDVGHQSAPRLAAPYVAVWLTGITSPEWDSPEAIEEHTIMAVSVALRRFTVAGDQRLFYPVGGSVIVADSTGNDGTYTVVTSTFAAGSTVITVSEVVPSATADGVLTGSRQIVGTRVLAFQIDVTGADALERAERIHASQSRADVLAALRAAGLAAYTSGPIADLTELRDTGREARAVFTARLAADSLTYEHVGILERIAATATWLAPDGTVARVDAVSADIDVPPYTP